MTFEEAVLALGRYQTRGWRLGLDRMEEFLRRLGLEEYVSGEGRAAFVHVAGTNGKGTTTAFVQSLLIEQGFRTGATFSPFVYDVRERVQVGRELIGKEDFARLTERLIEVGATMDGTDWGGPTEFEMKTAMGFLHWFEAECDAVALEVGLGGRLDATNVVDPAASLVVSIGYDHMQFLGDTLGAIAGEKAGILKPGRAAVMGSLPEEAADVVRARAAEVGAPLWCFGEEIRLEETGDAWTVTTPGGQYAGLKPPYFGAYGAHNMALAIAAVEAGGLLRDPLAVARGVERSFVPGRFERRTWGGRTVVMDGAHNPQAAAALAEGLRAHGLGEMTLVTAALEGHDVRATAEALKPFVARVHVGTIDFHRALPSAEVAALWRELGVEATAHATTRAAWEAATQENDPAILVAGSFYLLGELNAWI